MTIEIHKDSFRANGKTAYGNLVGTIDVDYHGKRIEVVAIRSEKVDYINLAGFVGRYRTSTNPCQHPFL